MCKFEMFILDWKLYQFYYHKIISSHVILCYISLKAVMLQSAYQRFRH